MSEDLTTEEVTFLHQCLVDAAQGNYAALDAGLDYLAERDPEGDNSVGLRLWQALYVVSLGLDAFRRKHNRKAQRQIERLARVVYGSRQ